MSDDILHDAPLEPERYELWADEDLLETSRREFLRIVGSGAVEIYVPVPLSARRTRSRKRNSRPGSGAGGAGRRPPVPPRKEQGPIRGQSRRR
jgi:hypothetical protein